MALLFRNRNTVLTVSVQIQYVLLHYAGNHRVIECGLIALAVLSYKTRMEEIDEMQE